MWAEQAIFTSMTRLGKSGYHVVARSPGISEADAITLATWSPSHGALIVDPANRTSVNFHPMPGGRHALSRTCEGPPEYSGRGGRQLYTHALVFDRSALERAHYQPFALYRDALALGHLHFRPEPGPVLSPVELSNNYPEPDAERWSEHSRALNVPDLQALRARLAEGQDVSYNYPGDRASLAECLLGSLEPDAIAEVSFATSLQPSAVRPYRLVLVGGAH